MQWSSTVYILQIHICAAMNKKFRNLSTIYTWKQFMLLHILIEFHLKLPLKAAKCNAEDSFRPSI